MEGDLKTNRIDMRRIIMKYLPLILLLLISCRTIPKEIEPNYRIIDLIIQNPDTLRVLGRDTIHFPNNNYPDEYREYSDENINWFKTVAYCFKANGYKIIDEEFSDFSQKFFKIYKVQIKCKKSDLKATLVFFNYLEDGYWRFKRVTSLGIRQHPNANAVP